MTITPYSLIIEQQVGTSTATFDGTNTYAIRVDPLIIDTDIIGGSYATEIPGGFTTLDIQLTEDYEEQPPAEFVRLATDIRFYQHIKLLWHSIVVFEGRIEVIKEIGSEIVGFTAFGYGICAVRDKIFESSSAVTTTSGSILRTAGASAATLLTPSADALKFVDPLVNHAEVDFTRMYYDEIVDAMCKEGGSTGQLWDFAVWENREIYFTPRQIPGFNEGQVDYVIPQDRTVRITRDAQGLYGAVNVLYQVTDEVAGTTIETKTADATNVGFVSKYGMSKTETIVADEMTAAGAAKLRDTRLVEVSEPKFSAVIHRNAYRGIGMLDSMNSERDNATVRAGQWVRIGGYPSCPIVQTVIDIVSGDCEYTIGELSQQDTQNGMLVLVKELKRATLAAERGTNPRTGGRKRR